MHVCVCVCVLVCTQSTFVVRFALPDVSGLEEYDRYMEHLQDELDYQFQVCLSVFCLSVCLTD